MLSTRAGLYNPVLKPRRVKRREREFREYKAYMAQFYDDAQRWRIDPSPWKKGVQAIEATETFETEDSGDLSEPGNSPPNTRSLNSSDAQSVYLDEDLPAVSVSSPGAASSLYPGSRVLAAAVTLAGQGLARFHEPYDQEVEYYSSDSEDDEEDLATGPSPMNSGGALSTMSAAGLSNISVVARRAFFAVRRRGGEGRTDENIDDTSSLSSRAGSTFISSHDGLWRGRQLTGNNSSIVGSNRKPPRVPPASAFMAPTTPTAQQQHQRHQLSSYRQYMMGDDVYEQQFASGPSSNSEMEPLTPDVATGPRSKQPPAHPQKGVKSLGRTSGASKLEA